MCFFQPICNAGCICLPWRNSLRKWRAMGSWNWKWQKREGRSAYRGRNLCFLGPKTGSEKVDQVHAKDRGTCSVYWLKTRGDYGLNESPCFEGAKPIKKWGGSWSVKLHSLVQVLEWEVMN
ncbi:hypothetical protein SLA2020_350440 [Shorea laevis]